MTRRGGWIQTYGGRQYWPLDPRSEEVDIKDIAHALSLICRYTGHCERFYSVAEHSVNVSYVVQRYAPSGRPALFLHALLHDAAEAYCNDIARPVKRSISGYAEIEGLNFAAICEHFEMGGLFPEEIAIIHQADNAMLLAEMGAIMKTPPVAWDPIDVPTPMLTIAKERIKITPEFFNPVKYGAVFLRRFRQLNP